MARIWLGLMLWQGLTLSFQDYVQKQTQVGDVHFNKAQAYFFKVEYDSAYFHLSRVSERVDPNLVAYMQGTILNQKKLFESAEEAFARVDSTFAYPKLLAYQKGNLYLDQNKFKKGIEALETADGAAELTRTQQVSLYHNMGYAFMYLKQFDKAEIYYSKELAFATDLKDRIYAKLGLAEAYYAQYKDSLAIVYFTEAYQDAQTIDEIYLKQSTARNLSTVEANRKDFQKALAYYKEFKQWSDSIYNRDNVYELLTQEKQAALEKKQLETDLERRNKNIVLVFGGLVTALLGFAIWQYLKVKQLSRYQHQVYSILSHDLRAQARSLLQKEDRDTKARLLNQSLDNLLTWALNQNKQMVFQHRQHALDPVVDQVLLRFEPLLADKQLDLHREFLEDASIVADLESLKIILRNLVDNAIKFSPIGQTLHVITTADGLIMEHEGMRFTEQQESYLLSTQRHIEVDRNRGIGLGLSLCKSLAQENRIDFRLEQAQFHAGQRLILKGKHG